MFLGPPAVFLVILSLSSLELNESLLEPTPPRSLLFPFALPVPASVTKREELPPGLDYPVADIICCCNGGRDCLGRVLRRFSFSFCFSSSTSILFFLSSSARFLFFFAKASTILEYVAVKMSMNMSFSYSFSCKISVGIAG